MVLLSFYIFTIKPNFIIKYIVLKINVFIISFFEVFWHGKVFISK